MESATATVPEQDLVPITAHQRIEALDVVRGFALLGIFLMNIEYFNRTITSLDQGMPRGLTGIDWFASWFIAYFVQGKFWTIFSLLFGMGFAVMMTRAAQAGREFKIVYLRRVLALALFGAAHFILLWEGDILFSYSVGALMLMIVLYGKTKPILIGIAAAAGLAFIPGLGNVAAVAIGLASAGLLAIHLRSGKHVTIRRHAVPLFSFLLLVIGSLLVVAAAVFWLLPDGPVEPRLPLSVFGPLLLLAGWLSWKYYEPAEKRSVRLAVSVYLFLGDSGHDGRTHSAVRTRSGRRGCDRAGTVEGETGARRGAQGRAGQGARRSESGQREGAAHLHQRELLGNGEVARRPVPGESRQRFRLRHRARRHVPARDLVRALGRHGKYRGASAVLPQARRVWLARWASGSDCSVP